MSLGIIGAFELLILFTVGLVAIPGPLGIPPLPEDPAIVRAAPADTLAFVEWFGHQQPNAQSANATERLAAEPEVRELFARVARAIRSSIAREADEHEALASEALQMAELALSRPGCLFVSGPGFVGGRFDLRGGAVFGLGEHAQKAEMLMRKLEGAMIAEGGAGAVDHAAPAPVDGVQFRILPVDSNGPPVSWAVVDRYLAIAVGADVPAQVVRGLRGGAGLTANKTFAELSGKVRVARPCTRSFVDLGRIFAMAKANGGEQAETAITALGIGALRGLLTESGLEGPGFTTRSLLATSGEPTGLMKLLAGRPVTAEDLAVVPGDATFAVAARCSPQGVLELAREMLGKLDDNALEELDMQIEHLDQFMGLRLEQDLLAHLGDTVTVWNSPGQGGLIFTGVTAAITLRDADAFRASVDKMMARIRGMMPRKEIDRRGRIRRGVYLEQQKHGDVVIHYLNTVGDDDVPFAPAWCVTDTHVMFSLFPQMLRATLDRKLDVQTSIAQRLPTEPAGAMLSYVDAKDAFRTLYPLLHPLAQIAVSEMQRDGFDIDISALPTLAALLPHLGAETSRVALTEDGVLMTRMGTLPFLDPILGGALPGVWLGFAFDMQTRRRRVEAEMMRAREVQQIRAAKERARKALEEAEKKKKKQEKRNR